MVTGGSMQQASPNMVVVGASMSPAVAEAQKRTTNDHRRSNKPIMEKRRRARINNCLNELKSLILDAMKKDPARHSKLEKADILEMTVKHLETLRAGAGTAPLDTFRAGYRDCADEVGRYPGLDAPARRRLLQHLASRLASAVPSNTTTVSTHPTSAGVFLSTGPNSGVQLVPTRLPNGDIALVLPAQSAPGVGSNVISQLPVLVPIPSRTSSTASASSAVSNSNIQRCYSPISPPPTAEWSPSSSCSSYSPECSTSNLPNTSSENHRPLSPFSTTSESIPQPSTSPYPQHPGSPYNAPRVSTTVYQEVHQDHISSYGSVASSPRPYSPEVLEAPLSLVIRKDSRCFEAHDEMMNVDDDKPWRPW